MDRKLLTTQNAVNGWVVKSHNLVEVCTEADELDKVIANKIKSLMPLILSALKNSKTISIIISK